jgi:nitrate/nitrite-specific signal transduction histidine kinase
MNEVILNERTADSIDLTNRALNGFDSVHSDLLVKVERSEMRKLLTENIDPKWRDIKKGITPFLENHYMDIDFNDDEVLIVYGALITDTEDIISEIDRHIIYMNEDIMHQLKKVRYAVVLTFFGMLVLISIHLYKLYKSVTHPIEELLAIADGLNKGDMSIKMDESKKDEFGMLARHFNNTTVKRYYATEKLKINSDELLESNAQLQEEIIGRKRIEEHMVKAY